MRSLLYATAAALVLDSVAQAKSSIPRKKIVQSFNVRRNASSKTTPLQVGNGNLAFGADITGLQTFEAFNTLSTWGWHNFSLPTTAHQTSPDDFAGVDWPTHGRQVNYDAPNPAQPELSDWLIKNPQRLNLARIGLDFGNASVTEADLANATQELDLWTGGLKSQFLYKGVPVEVETWAHPEQDMIGISITSDLLATGELGMYIDFPDADTHKFDAPFVGVYPNVTATSSNASAPYANSSSTAGAEREAFWSYFDPWYGTIQRTLVSQDGTNNPNGSSYYLQLQWDNFGRFKGPLPGTKGRYLLNTPNSTDIMFVVAFSVEGDFVPMTYGGVSDISSDWWSDYWTTGAFVDLTSSSAPEAKELQRRTILSQYLSVVNGASSSPPQGEIFRCVSTSVSMSFVC